MKQNPQVLHGGCKVIAVIAALGTLAACAPMSVQEIRATGARESFSIPGNYQANYRILVDEMRRCMQSGMITATVIVHGEIYSDIKKAVITPTMHGGLGASPLLVVDVLETGANETRIDVMSKSAGSTNAKLLKGVFDKTPLCAP